MEQTKNQQQQEKLCEFQDIEIELSNSYPSNKNDQHPQTSSNQEKQFNQKDEIKQQQNQQIKQNEQNNQQQEEIQSQKQTQNNQILNIDQQSKSFQNDYDKQMLKLMEKQKEINQIPLNNEFINFDQLCDDMINKINQNSLNKQNPFYFAYQSLYTIEDINNFPDIRMSDDEDDLEENEMHQNQSQNSQDLNKKRKKNGIYQQKIKKNLNESSLKIKKKEKQPYQKIGSIDQKRCKKQEEFQQMFDRYSNKTGQEMDQLFELQFIQKNDLNSLEFKFVSKFIAIKHKDIYKVK